MTFGIKRKQKQRLIGVKNFVHDASTIGSKSLAVGAVLFPEFAPELVVAAAGLKKVSKLTKK